METHKLPWRCWGLALGSSKDPSNGVQGEKRWPRAPLCNSALVRLTKLRPEKSKLILVSNRGLWGWRFSHLELRAGDPGVLLDRAILSSSSLKDQLLLFQVIIQDEVWFILPPMDGVAQVNALKGSGWLLLPSPPIRRPSISPLAVSTLLSPPLKGAPNREAPSYRAHSWASSKNRPISGSKVNIQVALNSFEALKFVLGKTPRSAYEYWAVRQFQVKHT